jgi:hypothetical protein
MPKTNNTSAGKGGVRRRESKSGSFDVGHALIAWDSTAGNVDTRSEAARQEEYVREENEIKKNRRRRNAIQN